MVSFTDVSAGLPGVFFGPSVAWGDFDNDSDLDVLITGYTGSQRLSRIYRNDGAAGFTNITAGLPPVIDSSVAWGDYDNDGDLDVLMMGDDDSKRLSRLYRNDGPGGFTNIAAGWPDVLLGSGAWGDYDNDGDLDVLMTGSTWNGYISRIYRNDGAGVFTGIPTGLSPVVNSAVAWGDYDNDGDLDVLIAGETGVGYVSHVYRNDGADVFVDIVANLPGVIHGSVAWGDYDNDGDLDVLITGDTGVGLVSRIYRNDGAGVFFDITAGLPGVYESSASWGDYDNDGDIDVLLTGTTASQRLARIYSNVGAGVFADIAAGLPGVSSSSSAWGDYDNDGDLDVLIAGSTGTEAISRIYRNDGVPANTPPTKPSNLTAAYIGTGWTFSWDAASDAQTPAEGLSYNLRIGATPGGDEIVASMADATSGYRRVVQLGNAQQRTSWTLKAPLPAGTYYWSVQALDGTLAGSAFTAEQVITSRFTETLAALTGVYVSVAAWGDYDNDGDLDVLLTGNTGTGPISRIYRNDGAGVFVDIAAGLIGLSSGSGEWGDYDNDGDLDVLVAGSSSSGIHSLVYRNDGAAGFTDAAVGLPGVTLGSVAWGDYDNDGTLDVFLAGWAGSQYLSGVYSNNGAGAFSDMGSGLPGVAEGSTDQGDYDSDGDLDLLITGNTGSGYISRIYRNDGAGVFTDIMAGLPGVRYSSVAWGDYDNDGDLDVLMSGWTDIDVVSSIYRNDGDGVFVDIAAGLTGVYFSSASWGDYDNDGDLDVLTTGMAATSEILSLVYRNDGAGVFTKIAAGLPGVSFGSGSWGDYDNDGDLDVLLTGDTGSGYISRVYRNDVASPNTPPSAPGNLGASFSGGTLTFSWNTASDAETPPGGLSYNLRVGTTLGGEEILAPMADGASGYRRVVQPGDAHKQTSWRLESLPTETTYYWSVQTVDGAFTGSAFAPEQAVPSIEFSETVAGLPPVSNASVAWGDYDNDSDLDVLLAGDTGSGYIARIYRNDGSGVFVDITAGLTGAGYGSVAWGDYDNDSDLDVLLTGDTGSGYIARIYRNDGSGVFVDITAGLIGVSASSVAWGDHDNDGDLDILLTGDTGSGLITRIYRNDRAGVFTELPTSLPGISRGFVAWGDCDNDGDLDVLLSGWAGSGAVAAVYRNDGAGVFVNVMGLTGVYRSSGAWGDYDNDGDLDILLAGRTNSALYSAIYRNDGVAGFTDTYAGLTGIMDGSAAWGDYDNDGDLDVLLTGDPGLGALSAMSRVYRNDGAGGFPSNTTTDVLGVRKSGVAWGDFDNDGDIDILLAGETVVQSYTSRATRIIRNDGASPNTPPTAPGNLAFGISGDGLRFSWDTAIDAQTPTGGLSYNLRVGTTPGGDEIYSSIADATTGYRRVVQLGNAQQRTSWTIAMLPESTYYWTVQALDGNAAGSPFAAEQMISYAVTGVVDHPPVLTFALKQNVPNPFNPRTTIAFDLSSQSFVHLMVYDIAGRLVRVLEKGKSMPAGSYKIEWDGHDDRGRQIASGVYLCKLTAGSFSEIRRMVLIK